MGFFFYPLSMLGLFCNTTPFFLFFFLLSSTGIRYSGFEG